ERSLRQRANDLVRLQRLAFEPLPIVLEGHDAAGRLRAEHGIWSAHGIAQLVQPLLQRPDLGPVVPERQVRCRQQLAVAPYGPRPLEPRAPVLGSDGLVFAERVAAVDGVANGADLVAVG